MSPIRFERYIMDFYGAEDVSKQDYGLVVDVPTLYL